MVLGYLKQQAEKYIGGQKIKKAVITVPAYFNDSQRRSTIDAAKIAGLEVLRIINEPTAASIAYGLNQKSSDSINIVVFDLGGGTFDVSVLNLNEGVFEVKATNGNTHLGGDDFDNELMYYCKEQIKEQLDIDIGKNPKALRRLRTKCEKIKKLLSK